MKKLLFLSAFCLVGFKSTFAQNKGYISFNLGPSISIGEFASRDINNQFAGYAKSGMMIESAFAYKLGKYFGIGAISRTQTHFIDAQAYADDLSGITSNTRFDVESSFYSSNSLMLGANSSVPVSKNLSFESRLLFGFVNTRSPDMYVHTTYNNNKGWVHQNDVTSFSLSALIGVGFKYDVFKSLALFLNVDAQTHKPEFRDVVLTGSDGSYVKETYSQKMSTINIGFGIGYRL